jgi:nuclear protein NHN1
MPLQSSASQSTGRKRLATHDPDEPLANKVLKRGAETKEPVKIPLPKLEKSQKPSLSAVSPPHGMRAGGTRAAAMPTSPPPPVPTARSPAKASAHPAAPKQPVPAPPAGSSVKRKSMSSRREELLMQLKAVEDAIAKKRSKMQ